MGNREAELLRTLRRVPLFNELSENELAALAKRAAAPKLAANKVLENTT